jgi:ADP-ribosylglycohydrolase
MTTTTLESRYLGALTGLATGDAVGTTLEFARPGTFEPVTDLCGGGPFNLHPGEWTDDTSMALCLAESLIHCGGFDPHDQMRRYLRWWEEGYLSATGSCFDIGNTVAGALDRFRMYDEPYSGSLDPSRAGNGSLMRLAPISMRWRSRPADTARFAALSSRTTHAAEEAVDACRYYAVVLAGALAGSGREAILAPDYPPLRAISRERALAPAIAEIAAGTFRHREPPEIRGSGYVVHTLEAALWAVHRARDFRDGLLRVVNLGEDADTTGAVYGQLAGALFGVEAIPRAWREQLVMREVIERYARSLLEHSE